MMNILHLLWIIPLSIIVGIYLTATYCVATGKVREDDNWYDVTADPNWDKMFKED